MFNAIVTSDDLLASIFSLIQRSPDGESYFSPHLIYRYLLVSHRFQDVLAHQVKSLVLSFRECPPPSVSRVICLLHRLGPVRKILLIREDYSFQPILDAFLRVYPMDALPYIDDQIPWTEYDPLGTRTNYLSMGFPTLTAPLALMHNMDRQYPALHRLHSLCLTRPVTSTRLATLARLCPELRRLKLFTRAGTGTGTGTHASPNRERIAFPKVTHCILADRDLCPWVILPVVESLAFEPNMGQITSEELRLLSTMQGPRQRQGQRQGQGQRQEIPSRLRALRLCPADVSGTPSSLSLAPFPDLTRLELIGFNAFPPGFFASLSVQCPHLETLLIEATSAHHEARSPFPASPSLFFPCLKELSAPGTLCHLAQFAPGLKTLKLVDLPRREEESDDLFHRVGQVAPGITCLHLWDRRRHSLMNPGSPTFPKEGVLQRVCSQWALKELHCVGVPCAWVVQCLPCWKQTLECLDLRDPSDTRYLWPREVEKEKEEEQEAQPALHRMHSLTLHGISPPFDPSWISRWAPHLHTLHLAFPPTSTRDDTTTPPEAQQLPLLPASLRSLSVTGLSGMSLTDRTLEALSVQCPELECLVLKDRTQFTKMGVNAYLSRMKRLARGRIGVPWWNDIKDVDACVHVDLFVAGERSDSDSESE